MRWIGIGSPACVAVVEPAFIAGMTGVLVAIAVFWFRRDLALPAYLYVGASSMIAALGGALVQGTAVESVCIGVLACLSVADCLRRILPNELTYGLILTGLAVGLWVGNLVEASMGAAAGFAVLWVVRAVWLRRTGQEALGLGDAKLLAGVGALTGPAALPEIVFWAAIAGIVFGIAATGGRIRSAIEIPFGAMLAAATCLYLGAGRILFAL